MANEPGILMESVGDLVGAKAPQGRPAPPPAWTAPNVFDYLGEDIKAGPETKGVASAPRNLNFSGEICAVETASDFFGRIIVLPRSINTGIVVGTLNFTIDVYSSFQNQVRTFEAFNSTAGAGISITDLPSFPTLMPAQSGFTLTLEVLPEGPATINGLLNFDFDLSDASISIIGSRAVVFPVQPDEPVREILQSRTDVLRKANGTEQRRQLRLSPRQIFELQFGVVDNERRVLDTAIMGAQQRAVGLPIWHESVHSTAAVSISDTVINVSTTSFADYRVGGLAFTYDASDNFEVLEVLTIGATSLTFKSAFTKAFASGTLVMPLRTAFMAATTSGVKFPLNRQDTRLRFTVVDNDVDLSSTAAFSTFNSKVFLDEANMIRGTLDETMSRDIIVIDSGVGALDQFSTEAISRRGHLKMFFSRTRQRLWEVRQLVHALAGRQTSFYIPTFFPDLEPTVNIVSGSDKLRIKNIGYTTLLASATPRDAVQLVKTDGTKSARLVLSSVELSPTEEELTLSATWGINATLAEIERVEYLEKVRFDSDEVTFDHVSSLGEATISVPLVTVSE